MRIYISGKISGLPMEEVREKFARAERQVAAFGHTPVNPLNNRQPGEASWARQMTARIGMLFECDAIYLLHDWKESRGARIERNIADEMDFEIIEQPKYAHYDGRMNKQ